MTNWITIRGAREHNLKNIDVQLPRDKLVVITGLSGSGKSSLAFDTIFAEGQRRYVESLSAYARQFLGQLEKPDVDSIEGLSPAIAIDQKGVARNPRSTVGTVTEIYDYLRLLFARVGRPHCPLCNRSLSKQSPQQMIDAILRLPEGDRILLLGSLVRDRKGEHQRLLDEVRRQGFVRVRIDGEVRELDEPIRLEKYRPHTIEVVVDRLVNRNLDRTRLADSVETALKLGQGALVVHVVDGDDFLFSENYACPVHGPIQIGQLEPRDFSFNSPHGACTVCSGLGLVQEIDPELVIPDRNRSLAEGAIVPWRQGSKAEQRFYAELQESLAEHLGFSLDTPVRLLPPEIVGTLLYGSNGDVLPLRYRVRGELRSEQKPFEGVIPCLRRRLSETQNEQERSQLNQYTTPRICSACHGARLRPEILAVTVAGATIAQVAAMTVQAALTWTTNLSDECTSHAARSASGLEETNQRMLLDMLSQRERLIARPILKEICSRLSFLMDVGLNYLQLDRPTSTLSGGEAQRIRLATQVGAGLSGVLYVLDEPSIGLHPRDNQRLLRTLCNLRELGNSVLVVEHDEEIIRAADWVIDIGLGAGGKGGSLVASGPLEAIQTCEHSITGQFLNGARRIAIPKTRRKGNGKSLTIRGAREHNLKNIDVSLPLGVFICFTGVSGSGKSTLVIETLYARLAQILYNARERPGQHDALFGSEHIDKVIAIDQAPIGRTPRSNPATYTKVFDPIRNLFAQTAEARTRGYDASRFSFNVKGGRCESCGGEGLIQVEMQFLPDLFIPCEVCGGTRYNRETLEVRYRGRNIAEVLDMTIEEAADFFARIPTIREKLQTLIDVGLGYLHLGQPANTLSGGEAQRIKLASELSRRATGRTLYILDEPTTGLHTADIERLLLILQRLVDAGNTVLVIEHNLDVIKSADWVIDIGPEGGDDGGYVVAAGTPEQVAASESHTGTYVRRVLNMASGVR